MYIGIVLTTMISHIRLQIQDFQPYISIPLFVSHTFPFLSLQYTWKCVLCVCIKITSVRKNKSSTNVDTSSTYIHGFRNEMKRNDSIFNSYKQRKFSAVLGTTSARNSISTLPTLRPPISISKNTNGLSLRFPATIESWGELLAHPMILYFLFLLW
jgi:hypothetical protein